MKPVIHIRPATLDDSDFILSLVPQFTEFGPSPWRTPAQIIKFVEQDLYENLTFPSANSVFLVAEDADRRPLGFIHLTSARDHMTQEVHGHISDIAVSADRQGQGVGQSLMAAAETWARERGYQHLTLTAFAGNTRARSLYQRLGYQEDTVRYLKPL